MPQDQQQWMMTALSFGILLLILTLRARRSAKVSALPIERLWIVPAFYTVVTLLLLAAHPPAGMAGLYVLIAFAAGALLGWYRGRRMSITVDPERRALREHESTPTMLVLFALVGVRVIARAFMPAGALVEPGLIMSITDVLLGLALGFVVAQRVELYQRSKAQLRDGEGGSQ
jgi:hypothetical protein